MYSREENVFALWGMVGRVFFENPKEHSHPERQSSSANHPSLRSSSLELFARDLLRNRRFRLGLRTGITSEGQVLATAP